MDDFKQHLIRAFGRHVELTVSDITNRARSAGAIATEEQVREVMDRMVDDGLAHRHTLNPQRIAVYRVTADARTWASAYLGDEVTGPICFEDRKKAMDEEFARLAAEGKTLNEIAEAMGRSYSTVRRTAKRRGLNVVTAKTGRPKGVMA